MYTYAQGGNVGVTQDRMLDFSTNINPFGLQHGVWQAIVTAIGDCAEYPDPFARKLGSAIANFENVNPNQVICGNGASDLIFRGVYGIKPKRALVLAPTCLDYEKALDAVGCEIHRYFLLEEDGFHLQEDVLDKLEETSYDMMFLCNPNNPTGTLIESKLMERILEICEKKKIYLIVDECFLGFVRNGEQRSMKRFLKNHRYLLVLKAFTELFAMAGIRLGYGLSSNQIFMKMLYAHGPDWNVSTLAQAAGLAALQQPQAYLLATREYIGREKEVLKKGLESLGFHVYDSCGNYIFFQSPYTFSLGKELKKNYGIQICHCDNYPGLGSQYYRIGILRQENNESLIGGMKDMLVQKIREE